MYMFFQKYVSVIGVLIGQLAALLYSQEAAFKYCI